MVSPDCDTPHNPTSPLPPFFPLFQCRSNCTVWDKEELLQLLVAPQNSRDVGTSAVHYLFQPCFPLILRRDKQVMERHQLFVLCRFPDTTLSDPDVAASHRYHTAIPDVFHTLPPTCHTGLLHEATQEKYNNVCEYPCPMPDTAMEHVHHLLKFVQHLMNNLSCSSLERAVYSCGGRVPLVFGGHLLQEEWVSPG